MTTVVAICAAQIACAAGDDRSAVPWTGEWHTYWRDGGATMTLRQDGRSVTGTYDPGGGRIEGQVDGGVFEGRWFEGDRSGAFVFALGEQQDSFTGRFDSGEYWNGERKGLREEKRSPFASAATPRDALRTVVGAANLVLHEGVVSALPFVETYLVYEPPAPNAPDRHRRRSLLFSIIDLSTFRVYEAPLEAEVDDEARFDIGPVDASARYPLRFEKGADERWRLVVESEDRLAAWVDGVLEELGAESVSRLRVRRQRSPRGTIRDFLVGVDGWNDGGDAKALTTLDLSFLPEELRPIDGPILAEYLRRILDRAGYVIWQEVPDDPQQSVPYVHYRHPAGDVVIERTPGDDPASPVWRFSARTLSDAPALYSAIQALPAAEGLIGRPPLTAYFEMRESLRRAMPFLVRRDVMLENWQWLFMVISLVAAAVVAWFAGTYARALVGWGVSTLEPEPNPVAPEAFKWPVRVAVAGLMTTNLLGRLAIVTPGFEVVFRALELFAIAGVTWLLFLLFELGGGLLLRRAERTPGYADEIVTTLATGLAQLAVVIGGLVMAAETVDLPYEGVLTGLGVGGIALAFAARETVANMIGGAVLIADRPFRRGDLLEADGELGFVQSVGLRSTRLRRLDDTVKIIPNAQLSDKAIINWGMRRRRQVRLTIRVLYGTTGEALTAFVDQLQALFLAQETAVPEDCYIALADFASVGIELEFRGFFRVNTYLDFVRARHALLVQIVELAERMDIRLALPARIEGDVDEWRPSDD